MANRRNESTELRDSTAHSHGAEGRHLHRVTVALRASVLFFYSPVAAATATVALVAAAAAVDSSGNAVTSERTVRRRRQPRQTSEEQFNSVTPSAVASLPPPPPPPLRVVYYGLRPGSPPVTRRWNVGRGTGRTGMLREAQKRRSLGGSLSFRTEPCNARLFLSRIYKISSLGIQKWILDSSGNQDNLLFIVRDLRPFTQLKYPQSSICCCPKLKSFQYFPKIC